VKRLFFFVNWVYFIDVGYNLWPFGIFVGYLVYFHPFFQVLPRKTGNPANRYDAVDFRGRSFQQKSIHKLSKPNLNFCKEMLFSTCY
jgi:hypothetical protein